MFVIREAQMAAFAQAAQGAFADEMLAHLADFSPPLFTALGPEQMLKAVLFGIERARGHAFTCRGPVRLYLESMLLFGSYFDTDPQYPWAAAILKDPQSAPEMQRADRLFDKVMDYRVKVAGPDDSYTLTALRNIALLARGPQELPTADFIPAMRREIALIHPQKAAYLGDEGLDALIHKGIAGARVQRFSSPRAIVLVIVLMLACGHGCGADPLYPWIGRTLKEEADADPETKARRLEKKALTWLERVLAYFDREAPP